MVVCRCCGAGFAAHGNGIGPLCLGCLLDSALPDGADVVPPVSDAAAGLPAATEEPFDGSHFAHYRIVLGEDGTFVELGRGGMGVTYRALDTTLQHAAALKVVNPEFAQDASIRARFLREARAAAGLCHPHVASVFFFGERPGDGQLFYAMELVEGETLHARVRRCGGLPASTILEIGAQVADALAAAEARGLAHCDLKPANLMLVKGEAVNVKVIDFGLSEAVAQARADDTALTQSQGFAGTPAFASPEHFNVWQEVDARSDFYALGATLWYALTGQAPFAGRTPAEIRDRHLHAALPLEQLAAAHVPARLVELLRSLLSPNPAGRPQTTRALAAALARCRQMPPERPGGLRRTPCNLAAVVGALVLAAGWWTVSRHQTSAISHRNASLQRQSHAQRSSSMSCITS